MKHQRIRQSGFTLLEILAVIVIISVLLTMLMLGVQKMQLNSKISRTHLTFENLRAIQDEFTRQVGFGPMDGTIPTPTNVETGSADRTGNAVKMTSAILNRMTSLAASQKYYDSLTDKFDPGPPGYVGTAAWVNDKSYLLGDLVLVGTTSYVSVADHRSSLLNQPGKTNSPWVRGDVGRQVIKDAWGNPIIFVSSKMSGVTSGGQTLTVQGPESKSFWASAGPDGDFSKGDDNVYSFDKK